MCLSVDFRKTQVGKRRNPRAFVKRYKQVKVELTDSGDVKIKSSVFTHDWKPGMTHCGRKDPPVLIEPMSPIERAIHVYLRKNAPWGGTDTVWMEVVCHNEDLIACGRGSEEAYMQVYLTRSEYDRIRNKFTKRLLKNIASDQNAKRIAMNGCQTHTVAA